MMSWSGCIHLMILVHFMFPVRTLLVFYLFRRVWFEIAHWTLHDLPNVHEGTTGPRCLKRAFLKFMGVRSTTTGPLRRTNAWPKAGFYPGAVPGNRSVTVVGTSLSYQEWVKPNFGLVRMKEAEFGSMNFTDYQKLNKVPTNKTCLELMLENYQSEHQVMQQLHRRRW